MAPSPGKRTRILKVSAARVKVSLRVMYSYEGLGLMLALVALAAFWRDSLAARERALSAAARACKRSEVQLLDGALVISELGLRRNARGGVRIWRLYEFEFSLDGSVRYPGRVGMLGQGVEMVQLDRPDGTLIEGVGRVI